MQDSFSRGFVITTDAFIALTLLSIIVVLSFSYISQINLSSWDSIDLMSYARDESVVLEKSLALENSIKQASSELILVGISSSPDQFCSEVSIFAESNLDNPMLYAIKPGCTKTFSELVVVQRTIVVADSANSGFYVARVGAWYK